MIDKIHDFNPSEVRANIESSYGHKEFAGKLAEYYSL